MSHFKQVCECGVVLAQCKCMDCNRTVTTFSPCTHKSSPEVEGSELDEIEQFLGSLPCKALDHGSYYHEVKTALTQLIHKKVVEGRLIELDLLEQALNAPTKWDLEAYKMYRLEDLTDRLEQLNKQGE